MIDTVCEVCWTASWQPCEEGAKNAVLDETTGGWMQCGFCVLFAGYAALTKALEATRVLVNVAKEIDGELTYGTELLLGKSVLHRELSDALAALLAETSEKS